MKKKTRRNSRKDFVFIKAEAVIIIIIIIIIIIKTLFNERTHLTMSIFHEALNNNIYIYMAFLDQTYNTKLKNILALVALLFEAAPMNLIN